MDRSQSQCQYAHYDCSAPVPEDCYPSPPDSDCLEYNPQADVAYAPYGDDAYAFAGNTQTPTPMPSQSPSRRVSSSSSGASVPPCSDDGEGSTVVSVSTAFHPNAHANLPPPDTILSSSDAVLFYVHSPTILSFCPSAFRAFLGVPLDDLKLRHTLIPIDAPSAELNVILHMLYGTSAAAHSPSFETLVGAVDRMPAYSITPATCIVPPTPLYTLLLSHAPLHPLEVYSLAAHHSLHALAVATSSHLLSYSLSSITDQQAECMGAIYLRKLMLLHVGRFTALKNILLQPPHPHAPTRECGFGAQRKLTRAWALVSAYLAWDARPDLSTHSMQTALNPLTEHLTCEICHQTLRDRIKDVVVQWASVKRGALGPAQLGVGQGGRDKGS